MPHSTRTEERRLAIRKKEEDKVYAIVPLLTAILNVAPRAASTEYLICAIDGCLLFPSDPICPECKHRLLGAS